MCAQLITMHFKPGRESALDELIEQLRSIEQPDSGFLRQLSMQDQSDPSRFFVLALFESEEKARAREQDPRLNRVTVYRTLNTLVEKGLAHKVDPGDRVFRFSLTDHARCDGEKHVHEHPHFVCDSCGTVECLEGAEVVVKPPAPQPKGHAKSAAKRQVRQDGVVLHGTCESCVDEPVPRRASA